MTLIVPRDWASAETTSTGMCQTVLSTQIIETRTAVAFRARYENRPNPDPRCADDDYWPRFEARLSAPLGNRVVVSADDPTGYPWPVMLCGTKTRVEVPTCAPPPRPRPGTGSMKVGTHYGAEFGPEPRSTSRNR